MDGGRHGRWFIAGHFHFFGDYGQEDRISDVRYGGDLVQGSFEENFACKWEFNGN